MANKNQSSDEGMDRKTGQQEIGPEKQRKQQEKATKDTIANIADEIRKRVTNESISGLADHMSLAIATLHEYSPRPVTEPGVSQIVFLAEILIDLHVYVEELNHLAPRRVYEFLSRKSQRNSLVPLRDDLEEMKRQGEMWHQWDPDNRFHDHELYCERPSRMLEEIARWDAEAEAFVQCYRSPHMRRPIKKQKNKSMALFLLKRFDKEGFTLDECVDLIYDGIRYRVDLDDSSEVNFKHRKDRYRNALASSTSA